MFDRDVLAKAVLLTIEVDSNYQATQRVQYAYRVADLMITESLKANRMFIRLRIGPIEKQPKITPVTCRCKHQRLAGVPDMAFVLKDDEQVNATLEFFDRKGKKIASPKLDGVPQWSSTDSAKVSVTPAADGMSALIVATGNPDDEATITATADADLGDGVKAIVTTGDVKVVGGDVATSNMSFGEATPQP